MSAKNPQQRSLIRNYMEVKTFGSLRSAKRVSVSQGWTRNQTDLPKLTASGSSSIERVNSHRAISSSSASSDSRHHHRPYRISHPIDIGAYPLCLDFRTHIDNNTTIDTYNTTTTTIHQPPANNAINVLNNDNDTDTLMSDSPIIDPGEVIEIGIARTARVMRARLCRLHVRRPHRPATIVDGELQVICAAGRSAGWKRRCEEGVGGGVSPLGSASLRRKKASPNLVQEAWV